MQTPSAPTDPEGGGLDVRRIEKAFGIRPRDWKRALERYLAAGNFPKPGDPSLAAVGYPELFRATIFFTDAGLPRWHAEHQIAWPPLCCVCGRAAETSRDVEGLRAPYCAEHGSARLNNLMVDTGALAAKAEWITLTGRSPEFLAKTVEINRAGDVFPPWEVFPAYDSLSGFWKQSGQFWLTREFLPFWRGLDAPARALYVEKWHAPADWREWLDRG